MSPEQFAGLEQQASNGEFNQFLSADEQMQLQRMRAMDTNNGWNDRGDYSSPTYASSDSYSGASDSWNASDSSGGDWGGGGDSGGSDD